MKQRIFVVALLGLVVLFAGAPASAQEEEPVYLVVYKDGALSSIAQPVEEVLKSAGLKAKASTSEQQAEAIVKAIVEGPAGLLEAEGASSVFPAGTKLVENRAKGKKLIVRLEMDPDFLNDPSLESRLWEIGKAFRFPFEQLGQKVEYDLKVRPAGGVNAPFLPLPDYLPDYGEPASKPDEVSQEEPSLQRGQSPHRGSPQASGFLSGKSVFLSPGHGWYYNSGLGRWATQRGNTNNIVEDLSNGEACLNWLVKYLHNAGAGVYTMRERDLQTNMVIVDNEGTGYSETGSWTSQTPADGTYNGGSQRVAQVSSTETASAQFTPTIPEAGHYAVYVWYRTHENGSSDTSTATKIRVNHPGGTTEWTQNQTRDGYTWKYIGTYYFEAGANASTGSVEISNEGSETAKYVVADAVRFGGGLGDLTDPNGGGVSGEPRWEESGRYYRIYMGDDDTWRGTVSSMPYYAAWENESSWEDSVYVSWHTNAPDPGTGTSSFAYGAGLHPNFGNDSDFTGVSGGLELRNAIHDELINDIQAGWDAGWSNRGTYTAEFGELNDSYNPEMPAALTEIAFHDTPADAEDLRDPRFRQLTARAVYQGIAKYFADRDAVSVTLLPEPPENLQATLDGSGGIDLSWDAPPSDTGDGLLGDPATGYKVYMSTHPQAFGEGAATGSASYSISSGLSEGEVYYFRVSATNAGGESFPTETLAIRYQSSGTNPILIVSGFDRLDRFMMIVEDDPYSVDDLHREYLERMNSYDYVTDAAEAVASYGEFFDSCSNEAVEDGQISLSSYTAVIWLVGEESSTDDTFTSTEQTAVQTYLNSGGKLFVSGAEIGYDLVAINGGASQTFYQDYLKATYDGDDGDTYTVQGAGGIFASLGSLTFDDGTNIYNPEWPDQLGTSGGSTVNMTYSGGNGGNAGIEFTGIFQIVNLGFPWETILGNQRQAVMDAVLDYFSFSGGTVSDVLLEALDSGGAQTPSPTYTESGAWADSSAKSTAIGLVGTGSRFSNSETPSADTATITPDIQSPGLYNVYVTWGTSANASNVRYIVNHAGGQDTVYLDQIGSGASANSHQWILIGSYNFNAGQDTGTGSVVTDESTVTGAPTGFNTGRVYVDGFKWEFISSEVESWTGY